MSNFGFCKVHFYYYYIMWKTYADLFKGESVNSLGLFGVFLFFFFESVFIFLVFILTLDRTICNMGPFGNGLVCERKPITSSILFSLSYPKALNQDKKPQRTSCFQ